MSAARRIAMAAVPALVIAALPPHAPSEDTRPPSEDTTPKALWDLAREMRGVHRFSTLFSAQDVRSELSSDEGIDRAIAWCKETGVTHVYVETFRDGYRAKREALAGARDRLRAAGLEVSGCVTTTQVGKKSTGWQGIACYTDANTQETLRSIFAYTAGIFDEIMIDDFWFSDCACEDCDAARKAKTVTVGDATHPVAGDSWEDYRSELMVQLSRSHVIGAAKGVNPRARLIIKYPQWYDRFHERGYDVARETRDFDRIWVGTETRDYDDRRWGGTVQYEAYFIMRWLGGIGGERCGGGWFDPFGTTERTYVEQARQTVLGGARESLLFCYGALQRERGPRNVEVLRTHIPELLETAREVARRKPIGVAAYKPIASHPEEEPCVFDFVGMLGVPLVPCHDLPDAPVPLPPGASAAFFSVHALKDPAFLERLQALLARGTRVLLTDGLAKRLEGKVALERPEVLILEVRGDPKTLLDLPRAKVEEIRTHLLRDVAAPGGAGAAAKRPVSLEAPSRVGFYPFDDGSWVVENFRDEAVEVKVSGEAVRVEARGWSCRWR